MLVLPGCIIERGVIVRVVWMMSRLSSPHARCVDGIERLLNALWMLVDSCSKQAGN